MTLPSVTDMVPRIWYPVMATRPGDCMKVVGTELRPQTQDDLVSIVAHLDPADRGALYRAMGYGSTDASVGEFDRIGRVIRALTEERDRLRELSQSPQTRGGRK